ncbi:MAG: ABC transporter ATP-binding protein [Gemmatimonadales bacterium]
MTAAAFALRGITKQFGRTIALDSAQFELRQGTLHALLGENGAGKTTLMRLAFGMLRPDAGTMEMDGTVRRWRSSADAIAAGIGMVHQHFLLVPAMTVAENVSLGERGLFRGFDARAAAERVRKIGAETGLVLDPASRVADLPVGAQQRLEIVKALARDVKILILDEPTAVLSPAESQELYAWLRSFVARGRTVVLITHKVREALALADDVTVLRRGRTVLSGSAAALGESAVIDAMVGATMASGTREREVAHARTPAAGGGAVASLDGVSVTDERGVPRLRDATMDVRAGEIVGVAGVEGSGQRELLRVLGGRTVPNGGTARLPARIGFVPEDRLRDALIPAMTLVENFALKDSGESRGSMPWRAYESRTRTAMAAHDVRASGADSTAGALSGGNQQKFVLGRELEGSPELLVVENPTRGLDIRAAAHVLDELRAARASGVAIVAYSSDLDEVLAIADRMLVCFDGHITPAAADAAIVARALVGLE